MTDRYGTGWTVNAVIASKEGRLTMSPHTAGQKGIAFVTLWADVTPDGRDPNDIYFQGIYAGDDNGSFEQLLEGQDRKDAEAILLANDEWLAWAREEISQRRAA